MFIMAGQARILSKEEIRDLFSILSNRRDQVIFALGIYAGLRIGEIIALKCADVYTKSGGVRNVLKFVRLKKKNTVYSNIPVHPKLRKLLEAYYKEIKAKERKSKWLFPSVKSSTGHIERVRAHYILCSAFDRLNLEGASTHSLRRTCLTNMSRAGIPLRTIQEISGHANLGQLQAYLAVDPADTKKAIISLKY